MPDKKSTVTGVRPGPDGSLQRVESLSGVKAAATASRAEVNADTSTAPTTDENTVWNRIADALEKLATPTVETKTQQEANREADEQFWKACVTAVLGATAHESPWAAAKNADTMVKELRDRRKDNWTFSQPSSQSR